MTHGVPSRMVRGRRHRHERSHGGTGRRRALEGRAGALHLRHRRGDVPRRARRPLRRQGGRVHQLPPRAGVRVHGGRARARHRHARRLPRDERPGRDQSAHRRRRGARRALARRRPRRRHRLGAFRQGRVPGIRPRQHVPPRDQDGGEGHAGRSHSRDAPRGPAPRHDGAPRARLPRDPPRRAERPPAGGGDVRAGPLSGHPCTARQPRGHPAGRAPGAARRAASAAGRRRRELGRRGGRGRAPLRPGRDPDDHRLWPERRGAEFASALHRPPRARRLARGRRRVPPGGSAARRRLAPRPVHLPLRRSLYPAGDPHRADRHPRRRHRALLPRRGRHRGRRARGLHRLVRSPRARGRSPRVDRRGARKRRRCAPSARRASRATADSMPIP